MEDLLIASKISLINKQKKWWQMVDIIPKFDVCWLTLHHLLQVENGEEH